MTAKLLTEEHFEFLSFEEAAQAHLSLFMSKCHFVGNHMSRLNIMKTILLKISTIFIAGCYTSIGTASANSVESDLGCKTWINFDNVI